MSSVPTYYQEPETPPFQPVIPFQADVIRDVIYNLDYNLGVHELLLSGSVGSAKSLLASHLAVTHCMRYKKAHVGIGRKSMPSLKDTLFQMILDHIGDSIPIKVDRTRGIITFIDTGSKITCVSWSDKNYKKVRSYAFSAFIIEELTENEDDSAYKEIIMRIGRLDHILERWLLMPTNPDSPSHWAYKHFITRSLTSPTTHVYYSLTENNPFLAKSYIEKLKETMTSKEADRMLRGMWVEIDANRIYYNYQTERNFFPNTKYKIHPHLPVDIMHDFNIGEGKPMSCAVGQAKGVERHLFKEFHVDGLKTYELMEEIAASGLFELPVKFRIFGDAAGKYNDTRSIRTDYEHIEKFLQGYVRKDGSRLEYEIHVPLSNPPLRRRHNLVNALCFNELGQVRFFVYAGCEWIDEGMRLTAPKKGSGTIEDDSVPQQHVTTGIGYWCDYLEYKHPNNNKTNTRQL